LSGLSGGGSGRDGRHRGIRLGHGQTAQQEHPNNDSHQICWHHELPKAQARPGGQQGRYKSTMQVEDRKFVGIFVNAA